MPIVAAIPAIIGAGSSIAGGIIAKKSASSQAKAAKDAALSNEQLQLKMFEENRADQAPFLKAGTTAVNQLSDLTAPGGEFTHDFSSGDFTKDPGYDFRIGEANKALQRSAAARGNLFSGGTQKAISRYNQNFASNEFQNAYERFQNNRATKFNELASLAHTGQISADTTGQQRSNVATNIGNLNFEGQTEAANANAAGNVGLYQGINNGVGNILNWYLLNKKAQSGGIDPSGIDPNIFTTA